jgi:hypothetical protein
MKIMDNPVFWRWLTIGIITLAYITLICLILRAGGPRAFLVEMKINLIKIVNHPSFWRWFTISVMTLIYFLFAWLNLRSGGTKAFMAGTKGSVKMSYSMLPDLLLMFALSGQIGIFLMSNYGVEMKAWVDGTGGMTKTLIASIISPSSITMMPIVKGLWNNNGDKLFLLFFMVVSSNLGWQIMLIRAPLVSWSIYIWVIVASIFVTTLSCMLLVVAIRIREFLNFPQMLAVVAAYAGAFWLFMKKLYYDRIKKT